MVRKGFEGIVNDCHNRGFNARKIAWQLQFSENPKCVQLFGGSRSILQEVENCGNDEEASSKFCSCWIRLNNNDSFDYVIGAALKSGDDEFAKFLRRRYDEYSTANPDDKANAQESVQYTSGHDAALEMKSKSSSAGIPHIVTFGRTGSGKSWCGNRLAAPGQPMFKEDDSDESVTTNISSHVAFNGDLISDVPGYFDSQNRDAIQQANFVDFLKKKSIRAIVFLYTDRVDAFMKSAAEAFMKSELKDNIIFVKNKVLAPPPCEVESALGCPKITIRAYQDDVEVLKSHIKSMEPVQVTHLITPVSLFRQPLKIVREEIVSEFVKDENIPVTIQLTRDIHVPVEKTEWDGRVGKIFGIRNHWTEWEKRTESYNEVVKKPHQVFNKVKYVYAFRFDDKPDIYSKEFLEVVTVEIK